MSTVTQAPARGEMNARAAHPRPLERAKRALESIAAAHSASRARRALLVALRLFLEFLVADSVRERRRLHGMLALAIEYVGLLETDDLNDLAVRRGHSLLSELGRAGTESASAGELLQVLDFDVEDHAGVLSRLEAFARSEHLDGSADTFLELVASWLEDRVRFDDSGREEPGS